MHIAKVHYLRALISISWRELLRFVHQRERLIASLVRPVLWFVVFSAGLRASLQLEAPDIYQRTLIDVSEFSYEMYLVPGLVAMVLLFSSMQSALSMVFDREMGSIRVLLVSPLPRSYLLFCKLFAGALIAMLQVALFLCVAGFFSVGLNVAGLLLTLPLLLLASLCCGALGLYLSSLIKQLENFAGVMNFVIFPLFFLSSALYPLSNFSHASGLLYLLAMLNPLTHIVEMLRYSLLGELNLLSILYVSACFALFNWLSARGYNPSRGMMKTKFS